jgi:hypothetical protein
VSKILGTVKKSLAVFLVAINTVFIAVRVMRSTELIGVLYVKRNVVDLVFILRDVNFTFS